MKCKAFSIKSFSYPARPQPQQEQRFNDYIILAVYVTNYPFFSLF